jgi:hypothetical protein
MKEKDKMSKAAQQGGKNILTGVGLSQVGVNPLTPYPFWASVSASTKHG